MGRLLVLVLIVVLAVWLIRRALRPPRSKDGSAPPKTAAGELVSCARCGLNLPREEARESSGALFCSEEHARLGRGGTPS
jgi:uncharacterized protein